jgi:hypothetical protein
LLAVAIGGWNDPFKDVTEGALDGAKNRRHDCVGLIGIMASWLGVMRSVERAGIVQRIARGLRPIMRRLFPDVPPEHPAMGSMVMNMSDRRSSAVRRDAPRCVASILRRQLEGRDYEDHLKWLSRFTGVHRKNG